jgi:hypothetical protein
MFMTFWQLKEKRNEKRRIKSESGSQTWQGEKKRRRYVCIACGRKITTSDMKFEKDGKIEHTFANPSGIVFRIGCFLTAPGTLASEKRTGQFSWFDGYMWSGCICIQCGLHLGWRFESGKSVFFGLILDRIKEERTGDS